MSIDGVAVAVPDGTTLLEACDTVGRYVPRLCSYPGLGRCAREGASVRQCGLCAIRLQDGSVVPACTTRASSGMEVTTRDSGLERTRWERLARVLVRHPHACLSCPDRDGCTRDHCTYGYPVEARCCDELGRCELGRLVAHLGPGTPMSPGAVTAVRETVTEGRIRREPGLCIGCGRCVLVCETLPQAGKALAMHAVSVGSSEGTSPASEANGRRVPGPSSGGILVEGYMARPKRGTLRASGCTFCGQCVMVCPAGALSAPGDEGARWLAERRASADLARPVLPPETGDEIGPPALSEVPTEAGVFRLIDSEGRVLRIGGVANLREGLTRALTEPGCSSAVRFMVEIDPLFTQRESELLARYAREHGSLPPANDLPDELFGEDLFEDNV